MATLNRMTFHKTLAGLSRLSCRMSGFRTRGTSPGCPTDMQSKKLIYPAANRNKDPILDVLKREIPKYFAADRQLFCLEVASGSGQHLAYFAPHFPNVTFQPSEYAREVLDSIAIYADECPTRNIKPPLNVDIRNDLGVYGSHPDTFDMIYCANMIHISPFACTVGLFNNAGRYLKPGGILVTYGAYAIDGIISPQSNVDFDMNLRSQNGEWGVRCLTKLAQLAAQSSIILKDVFDMPANNKCVIWRKEIT